MRFSNLSRPLNPLYLRVRRIVLAVPALTVALAAATFLLYWRTAAPTVLPGDSGELQFAAWGFWLAHPTGYPLYLILGGIWQHVVQIGDPAYRLNLFSAFWSALAVGVAFLVFWNVTRSRAASGIAALTLAVSPLFWSQATRAEVYAFNTFFLALLTLWALLWRANRKRKYAVAFALTFGLALTHHRSIILALPALAAFFADIWLVRKFNLASRLNRALLYVLLTLVPLLLYLYIPLRAGATPYATLELATAAPIVIFENSPRGWLNVILGSGFSGALSADATTWNALRDFPNTWLAQLNPFGILATLFGVAALWWQKKFWLAAFIVYGILTWLLFNSVYHIGDIADYYTPIYFFSALAISEFVAFGVRTLRALPWTRASALPNIFLLACFALLPLQNLFNNFIVSDHSREFEARKRWAAIFSSQLPDNAILLSNDRDEMTPLYFLQLVEKQHPGWVGVFPKITAGAEYENVVALVKRLAPANRPIYAVKPIPALTLRYPVEIMQNGLWLVKPGALAAPQHPANVRIGDALSVLGYSTLTGEATAGKRLTLAIQFRVLKHLARDYTGSVQIFAAEGGKVAQGNDHIPGQGEYPATKWRVGETVQDQFDIELNSDLDSGDYRIMLRLYDPSSGEELGELTEVGSLHIKQQ